MSLSELEGDVYVTVLLAGVVELAGVICIYLVVRRGRRLAVVTSFSLAGLFNCLSLLLDLNATVRVGATAMTLCSRACICACWFGLSVWTAELYPTPVRSRVYGYCNGVASAVAMTGPYIITTLRNLWDPLPSLIFGVLALAAGIVALFLPETIHSALPETLEDAQRLAQGKSRRPNLAVDSIIETHIQRAAEGG